MRVLASAVDDSKRGGVAAYHIVWIGLCLRSVPGVRVLSSASVC